MFEKQDMVQVLSCFILIIYSIIIWFYEKIHLCKNSKSNKNYSFFLLLFEWKC